MANTIRLKRGTSDPGSSDLVSGELAIRTDTGKLFTKLDNDSIVEISGGAYLPLTGGTLTGVLAATAGSNSAPAIHFGDSDSGIYGGTNTVSLAANGTQGLTLDSSAYVNVPTRLGVGIGVPVRAFHIHEGSEASAYLHMTNDSTGSATTDGFSLYVSTAGEAYYRAREATGKHIFYVNSDEAARVDSSGRLLVGYSSPIGIANNSLSKLQTAATDKSASIGISRFSANTSPPILNFAKARGEAVGTMTSVQEHDDLGEINFCGSDGADLGNVSSRIRGAVDGTPGTDNLPGRLEFATSADGENVPTTRLTIDSAGNATFAGNVGIGTTTSPSESLDVEGTIECLNELRSKTGNDLKLNAGSVNRDVFLQVNDSTLMTVQGSTGNVGIGTTPTSSLHVSVGSSGTNSSVGFNEFCIEGGDEDIGMCFLSPAANERTHTIAFGDSNNNNAGKIQYNHSTDDLTLTASDNIILSGDAVGINENNPTNTLHLGASGADQVRSIKIDGTNGASELQGVVLESDGANSRFNIKTGAGGGTPSDKLTIATATGNVGINENNPIAKLIVNSGTTDLAAQLVSSDANVFLAFKDGDATGNQQVQIGGEGNNLVAYAGGTEKLRITSDGFIGVGGITAPTKSLDIATSTSADGIRIKSTGDTYNEIAFDANRTNANNHTGRIISKWNGTTVSYISFDTGSDTGNKDNGQIRFWTSASGGSNLERLRITSDGNAIFTGNVFVPDSKEIQVGNTSANPDFKIYHSAQNYIQADNGNIIFWADGVGKTALLNSTTGACELHYGGATAASFSTTATGAKVKYALQIEEESGSEYYQLVTNSYGGLEVQNETTKVCEFTDASTLDFPTNHKIQLGTGSDLKIYFDGDSSYIEHTTDGTDLIIDAKSPGDDLILRAADDVNIRVQGNEDAVVCKGDGAVELYWGGTNPGKKFNTTSDGGTLTGNLFVSEAVQLNDNKKIELGNSADLTIWHGESNSGNDENTNYISSASGRNIVLQVQDDANGIIFHKRTGTGLLNFEPLASFTAGGACKLHYDGATTAKLETTSSGISVSGSITGAGHFYPSVTNQYSLGSSSYQFYQLHLGSHAYLDNNAKLICGNNAELSIHHDGIHTYASNRKNNFYIQSPNYVEIGSTDTAGSNVETSAKFIRNGAVELYFDDQLRLKTGDTDEGISFHNLNTGSGNSDLRYSFSGEVTYDSSSRLVKTDIEDSPYGIDIVKQLKPRKYKRTDQQDTPIEIGFVADEVQSLIPEIVPTGPKSIFTKNNSDTEIIPVNVDYRKLTVVLTTALQEAITRIETLETEVAALKAGS